MRLPEADCFDTIDDNGDGLADCADPTCLDRTECIFDRGGVAGYVADDGQPCVDEYDVATLMHQGAQQSSSRCSGCSCQSDATCTITIRFWPKDVPNCANSWVGDSPLKLRRFPPGGFPMCAATFPVNNWSSVQENGAARPGSIHYYSGSPTQEACVKQGSPSLPARTWTTDATFCGVTRPTSTCGSGKVCVARLPDKKRCVQLPGASACGGAYPNPSTYSQGFAAEARSCDACSSSACAPSALSCPGTYTLGADDDADGNTANGLQICTVGQHYPVTPNTVFHKCFSTSFSNGDCQSGGCYNSFTSIVQKSSGDWGTDNCAITQQPAVNGVPAGDDAYRVCCEL